MDVPVRLPRLKIGLLSEIIHRWMGPVMALKGRITLENLPQLPIEDSAPQLLERFNTLWDAEQPHATGDGVALRRTILKLVAPRFQLIALWQLLDSACNFLQPLIVSLLVRDLRVGAYDRLGWNFALVVLLSPSLQPVCNCDDN